MKKLSLLVILSALSLALSCSGDDGGDDDRKHGTDGKSWTFLVYMVADNNLEAAALSDLAEMIRAGTNGSFNILVQSDRARGYTSQGVGGLANWESTKRLKIGQGAISQLSDLGELNMGDPRVLSDFIAWGVKTAPADRVALIFWDHGGAWPGFGGDESTSNHDLLTLAELKQGITSGMQQAGLKQFALIGFDACLMATFETAMTMKPFGEYLLASEELEPGHGWDYSKLQLVSGKPTASPVEVAKTLISGFRAQAVAAKTDKTITLSLIDLYRMSQLQKAVDTLAGEIRSKAQTVWATVGKERAAAMGFGRDPNPSRDTHMIDLGLFARRLGDSSSALASGRDAVLGALKSAVLAVDNGQGTAGATGVSIYFPTSGAYYDKGYDQLEGVTAWRDMLKAYHGAGAQIPQGQVPRFTSASHLATVSPQGQGILVSGNLASGTGKNVVDTTLYYGVVDATSGAGLILGDRAGAVAGDRATASWDVDSLVLTQGSNQFNAYLGEAINGNMIIGTIPFAYYTASSTQPDIALLVLVADASTGSVIQSTYYLMTQAGIGELYPQAGSEIIPLVLSVQQGKAQWVELYQVGLDPTAGISYSLQDLAAGSTGYVSLEVVDFGGNGDHVYYSGTI